nr:hypothetical protein [uncultured Rhodopila sp.]
MAVNSGAFFMSMETGFEPLNTSLDSYAYLFAAKGIQRYVLDSGPLRDLVGASDLIAGLAANPSDAPDLIGHVLRAMNLEDGSDVTFSRRAGAAFCLHAADRQTLDRIRALWRLAIGLGCPGLECSHAGPVAGAGHPEALANAYQQGSAVRDNTAAELLPAGHPFTEFNRRTGRVITRIHAYKDDPVPSDMLTEPQRLRAQVLQAAFERSGRLDGVAGKFLIAPMHPDGTPFVFPRNLETDEEDERANPAFPFLGDERRIGVLHADLSGLGEIFQNVTERARDVDSAREISFSIETVMRGAVRIATRAVLEPAAVPWPKDGSGKAVQHVMPARPVVLGGDDITVLVRVDLVVPFTRALLQEIERQSVDACAHLAELYPDLDLPPRLSACAGIAVINAGAPFMMAQALAEDLCRFAKKAAKNGTKAPYPAYLAFHNAQSTLQEHYDDIHLREMTTDQGIRLTANPYRVTEPDGGTELDGLMCLGKILNDHPSGSGKLIEAARLAFTDPAKAASAWTRWRDVLQAQDDGEAVLNAIDAELPKGPDGKPAFSASIGPLTDALELADFGTFDPISSEAAEEPASW